MAHTFIIFSKIMAGLAHFIRRFVVANAAILPSRLLLLVEPTSMVSLLPNSPIKKCPLYEGIFYGAPGGDRTHNLWRRRPTLYPIELRVHLYKLNMYYIIFFYFASKIFNI